MSERELVSTAWVDAQTQRLHDATRELADVTSERDYLVARFTELASELESWAHKWWRAPGADRNTRAARFVAYTTAAGQVRTIVTNLSPDDNETATTEVQDGTRPERPRGA